MRDAVFDDDEFPNESWFHWRRVGDVFATDDDVPTETDGDGRPSAVWETREVREGCAREMGWVDAGDGGGGDGGDGGDGWTRLEGFAVGVRGVGASRRLGFEGERWR